MSVSSPFTPLMATEVRFSTLPSGTTRKLTSWFFLSMSLFGPLPGLSTFTSTALVAASWAIHFASVCVVFSAAWALAIVTPSETARAATVEWRTIVLRDMDGALLFGSRAAAAGRAGAPNPPERLPSASLHGRRRNRNRGYSARGRGRAGDWPGGGAGIDSGPRGGGAGGRA